MESSDEGYFGGVFLLMIAFPFLLLIIGWGVVWLNGELGLHLPKRTIDGLVITSVVIFYSDVLLEFTGTDGPIALASSVLIGGYANLVYVSPVAIALQPLLLWPVATVLSMLAAKNGEKPLVILSVAGTVFAAIGVKTLFTFGPTTYLAVRWWLGIGMGIPMACVGYLFVVLDERGVVDGLSEYDD